MDPFTFSNPDMVVSSLKSSDTKTGVIAHSREFFTLDDIRRPGGTAVKRTVFLPAMLMSEKPRFWVLAPIARIGHADALSVSAEAVCCAGWRPRHSAYRRRLILLGRTSHSGLR